MLRLPSLDLRDRDYPLRVYLLGARTVGKRAGLVQRRRSPPSAPSSIYYSTEARGYALMDALAVAFDLCLLRAAEGGGLALGIAVAAFSCAAMYSHCTVAFVLAAAGALWALRAYPAGPPRGAARRPRRRDRLPALALGGIADMESPTTKIASLLLPFTTDAIGSSLAHGQSGYPGGCPSQSSPATSPWHCSAPACCWRSAP